MHEGRALSGGPQAGLRYEVSRYEQRDRPAVLDFRRRHYGEADVRADPAYVDWQFRDAPGIPQLGAPLHVAKADGRIVGTIGKIRTSMYVRGQPVPASWVVDYAVEKELRRSGIGEAIAAASRKDGGTGLSLEGSSFTRGMEARFHYEFIAEVPLFVRAIDPSRWARAHGVPAALAWVSNAALPALSALDAQALRSARRRKLELVQTRAFDERADALFAELSRRTYPVLCRRDRSWLEWRFERYPRKGRYELFWLMRAGEVAGYAVLHAGMHRGVPSGVIADYLCAPGQIPALLAFCVERFRRDGAAVVTCLHLNALAGNAFRKLGFLRRNSGWRFLARREAKELGAEVVDSRSWFLTGGDSNVDRERTPPASPP